MRAKEYLKRLSVVSSKIRHRKDMMADGMELLKEEVQDLEGEYSQLLKEIESIAEVKTNFNYSELLYEKYVQDKQLKQIAAELDCSYETIRHYHGIALELFEKHVLSQKDTK